MSFPQGVEQEGRNEKQIITRYEALLKMSIRVLSFLISLPTQWDPVKKNMNKRFVHSSFIIVQTEGKEKKVEKGMK